MPSEKTLFETKWSSIIKKTMDNGSVYEYLHSPWCNGEGVAILPFRRTASSFTRLDAIDYEFLGRFEVCPAHSNDFELCSITGGMDKQGENPMITAWRELIEEGGYRVPLENIIPLGTVRPSKASDTKTHLFAVNLDKGFDEFEAIGDGTPCEEGAYCKWVSRDNILLAKDSLLHAMYVRLRYKRLHYIDSQKNN